jgi:hypothetical protein
MPIAIEITLRILWLFAMAGLARWIWHNAFVDQPLTRPFLGFTLVICMIAAILALLYASLINMLVFAVLIAFLPLGFRIIQVQSEWLLWNQAERMDKDPARETQMRRTGIGQMLLWYVSKLKNGTLCK